MSYGIDSFNEPCKNDTIWYYQRHNDNNDDNGIQSQRQYEPKGVSED